MASIKAREREAAAARRAGALDSLSVYYAEIERLERLEASSEVEAMVREAFCATEGPAPPIATVVAADLKVRRVPAASAPRLWEV